MTGLTKCSQSSHGHVIKHGEDEMLTDQTLLALNWWFDAKPIAVFIRVKS